MPTSLDLKALRSQFPALDRLEGGRPVAYLDGPGGTQVPQVVIDAMVAPLRDGVSNLGGGYGASDDAVRLTAEARAAMGRMFNTDPASISFGQNMTSLTFAMSRALSRTWSADDAIVLSNLDHDANYTPWAMAARDAGVEVRVAQFDADTGVLEPESVIDLLDERTRLVAVGLASNALGSVVDVAAIAAAAHEMGAMVYVDAVHAGPHMPIDVAALDCDFLVASAYKFFGPHTGILYGKLDHMAALEAYKVRPAPSDPPGKWETGTQSFESMAGVTAAVEYMESIGVEALTAHESGLGERFLRGIDGMPHVRLYGVPEMNDQRVSTFAIAVDDTHPDQVALRMIEEAVYVWSGHYYAMKAMEHLGVLDSGGLVRIGFVHYNTSEEVDRALEVLDRLG